MTQQTNPTLLEKFIASLGGFLIGTIIIIVFLKLFSSFWGVLIGLIANTGFYYLIKKKSTKSKETKHLIAKGILISVFFTIIVSILIWIFVWSMFQNLAN